MADESTSIQGFLLRYITLSYVIWLKNGWLSKFGKNIGIWVVLILKFRNLSYIFFQLLNKQRKLGIIQSTLYGNPICTRHLRWFDDEALQEVTSEVYRICP